jgi:hypothetical protein
MVMISYCDNIPMTSSAFGWSGWSVPHINQHFCKTGSKIAKTCSCESEEHPFLQTAFQAYSTTKKGGHSNMKLSEPFSNPNPGRN